jgi:hypothetical protein
VREQTSDVKNALIISESEERFGEFSEKGSEEPRDDVWIFFETEIDFVAAIICTLPPLNECDVSRVTQ